VPSHGSVMWSTSKSDTAEFDFAVEFAKILVSCKVDIRKTPQPVKGGGDSDRIYRMRLFSASERAKVLLMLQ
jgi:hypothetical protein